jgi:energy-coupling factor transport system ATP-binding protein
VAGIDDGRWAGAESPALWRDGIVARFWRWSARGSRARIAIRRFWADLKSTGSAREWAARPVLKEKLGYGIALGLASLALSPTVLMGLAERVASASGPAWLTALSVVVAGGLPLLRVMPSMLNVMAAALLGPWWGAGVMLAAAALLSANFAGYPELPYAGVFGVMVAGLVYRATGKAIYVVLGEIVGTGMIGAIANAALGIYATDTMFDWPGWVAMLLLPTSIGAALGGIALVAMGRAGPNR